MKYAGKTRKDIDVSKHPNSFRYDVANVEGRVDISYGTDTDANVMIALSNSSGVLYKNSLILSRQVKLVSSILRLVAYS